MSKADCSCYTRDQLSKVYDGLLELEKCRTRLLLKSDFIDTSSNNYEPIAWWQEPEFVLGGILVSASIATMLTVLMIKK